MNPVFMHCKVLFCALSLVFTGLIIVLHNLLEVSFVVEVCAYTCVQVMQGVGVGYFSKRFSDFVLLKYSVVLMALSYLLLVSGSISHALALVE